MKHRFPHLRLLALLAVLTPATGFAAHIKNFYGGSGGVSQDTHRVVLLELAEDGTALLQQNWVDRDPELFPAHWKMNGKQLTLTFDPGKDGKTLKTAIFELKEDAFEPRDWDPAVLGLMGPPTLSPYSTQPTHIKTAKGCLMLDPLQGGCTQWDSRDSK